MKYACVLSCCLLWQAYAAECSAQVDQNAAADPIVLTPTEIQAIRLANFYYKPVAFEALSALGKETLFGGRAKDVTSVVIEANGRWRWRTKNDIRLLEGGLGSPTDAGIIRAFLDTSDPNRKIQVKISPYDESKSSSSGSMSILSKEIDNLIRFSGSWIGQGGSVENRRPDLNAMVEQIKELSRQTDFPMSFIELHENALGKTLLTVSPAKRDELIKGLGTDREQILSWIRKAQESAIRAAGKLEDAPTATDQVLSDALTGLSLTIPKPRSTVGSGWTTRSVNGVDVFVIPVDPATTLYIKPLMKDAALPNLQDSTFSEIFNSINDNKFRLFYSKGSHSYKIQHHELPAEFRGTLGQPK